jgi:hypothetical protein
MRKTWKDYFDRGRRFSDDFPLTIEDLPVEDRKLGSDGDKMKQVLKSEDPQRSA